MTGRIDHAATARNRITNSLRHTSGDDDYSTAVLQAATVDALLALVEQRFATGRIVNVDTQRALLAEVRRLRAMEDVIRAALARHPRCDRYGPDEPISCGWKLAVHDIQTALDLEETP